MLECIAIEAVQTIFDAEPHEPSRVLRDGHHGLLGQAIIQAESLETHGRGGNRRAARAADHGEQQSKQCAGASSRPDCCIPVLHTVYLTACA